MELGGTVRGGFPVGVTMVRCGLVALRRYGNFIDNLRIYVRGGSGGMGLLRLGGEGGKGGDVWVVAQDGITLKKIKDKYPDKRFVAGVGANSSIRSLKGTKGNDCEIYAPVGVSVTNDDGKVIGELNNKGDRVIVARGGHGGSFVTNFLPSKGQSRVLRIDLKLVADVGLVGFPNAGKSTLLSQLSHAKPKIADYPFTTIRPEIGKLMYSDYKQVSVADLPGLIEGAHLNKGMGHKFLKHVERTKQLLFVVDVTGFQLSYKTPLRTAFEAIQLLTKELELYKVELLSKPALLAVNKMDLENAEEKFKELMQQLQQPQEIFNSLPKEMIPQQPIQFKHIIAVSASTRYGIEELKNDIRKSLDDQDDLENEQYHFEKLQSLRSSTFKST